MNPNSVNQLWSRWTFVVTPKVWKTYSFESVRVTCARFARLVFRSATEMKVEEKLRHYVIDVRTEGHPVHDPQFVERVRVMWQKMFEGNFGNGVRVELTTKLEAGSRQDGTPSDQLVILPSIPVH